MKSLAVATHEGFLRDSKRKKLSSFGVKLLMTCIIGTGAAMGAMFHATGGLIEPYAPEATNGMQNALLAMQMALSPEEIENAVGPPHDSVPSLDAANRAMETRSRVRFGNSWDFVFMVCYSATHVMLAVVPWAMLRYRREEDEAVAALEEKELLIALEKRGGKEVEVDSGRRRRPVGERKSTKEAILERKRKESRMGTVQGWLDVFGGNVYGPEFLVLSVFLACFGLFGDAFETLQQFQLDAMDHDDLWGERGRSAIAAMAITSRIKWTSVGITGILLARAWWVLGGVFLTPRPKARSEKKSTLSSVPTTKLSSPKKSPRASWLIQFLRNLRLWSLRIMIPLCFGLGGLFVLVGLSLRPPVSTYLQSIPNLERFVASKQLQDARWMVEPSIAILGLGYVWVFLFLISIEADLHQKDEKQD